MSGGGRLLDAGDRPLAAAVGGLDEVPDLVERCGHAVFLLADQAVEANADDLAVGFARDVEYLGIDANAALTRSSSTGGSTSPRLNVPC